MFWHKVKLGTTAIVAIGTTKTFNVANVLHWAVCVNAGVVNVFVTIKEYVPEALGCAFAIEGLCVVDENTFGPVHEYEAIPAVAAVEPKFSWLP